MEPGLIIAVIAVIGVVVLLMQQRSFFNRLQASSKDPSSRDTDTSVQQWTKELSSHTEHLDRREQNLLERENDVREQARQVSQRENDLDSVQVKLEAWERQLADKSRAVEEQRLDVERLRHEASLMQSQADEQLEKIASMSVDDAVGRVLERAESEAKIHAHQLAAQIEEDATREARSRARYIVATAIERIAAHVTSDSTVKVVDVPSDDMKGRIIGKDGRNIRTLEQVTGVTFIVDDTPGAIMLSCFDPVRREIARVTVTELIRDARISPATIEETYTRAKDTVDQRLIAAAEEALVKARIGSVADELLPFIGALSLRTSYGQNVLEHSVECADIAAALASEIGANPQTCRRAAFLHDLGKAVITHGEGSHALEGAEIARKHGEKDTIVHAIAAHHNEVPTHTVEDVLTQAADTISSSRPGSRRESSDDFVVRMRQIEKIASASPKVDKAYALQAGREVRVLVKPEKASDADSQELARQIADRISDDVVYPGQVKVTVIRESRATHMA